jgi:hypothetical protein
LVQLGIITLEDEPLSPNPTVVTVISTKYTLSEKDHFSSPKNIAAPLNQTLKRSYIASQNIKSIICTTKTLWGPDRPIFPRFPNSGRTNELRASKNAQTEDMVAEHTVIQNPWAN